MRASTVLTAAIGTNWVTILCCTCEESWHLNNCPAEELLFDSECICLFCFLAGCQRCAHSSLEGQTPHSGDQSISAMRRPKIGSYRLEILSPCSSSLCRNHSESTTESQWAWFSINLLFNNRVLMVLIAFISV